MEKSKRQPRIPARSLAGLYSGLRKLPPFNAWGLPAARYVRFTHSTDPCVFGTYLRPGTTLKHVIALNPRNTLLETVATLCHEMCHMKIELSGRRARKAPAHGPYFKRLARRVCRDLGFSLRGF